MGLYCALLLLSVVSFASWANGDPVDGSSVISTGEIYFQVVSMERIRLFKLSS